MFTNYLTNSFTGRFENAFNNARNFNNPKSTAGTALLKDILYHFGFNYTNVDEKAKNMIKNNKFVYLKWTTDKNCFLTAFYNELKYNKYNLNISNELFVLDKETFFKEVCDLNKLSYKFDGYKYMVVKLD